MKWLWNFKHVFTSFAPHLLAHLKWDSITFLQNGRDVPGEWPDDAIGFTASAYRCNRASCEFCEVFHKNIMLFLKKQKTTCQHWGKIASFVGSIPNCCWAAEPPCNQRMEQLWAHLTSRSQAALIYYWWKGFSLQTEINGIQLHQLLYSKNRVVDQQESGSYRI